jgi:hypothetical protein
MTHCPHFPTLAVLPPAYFTFPLTTSKTCRYVPGTVLILPTVIATRVAVLQVVKGRVYVVGLGLLYIRMSQMTTLKKRRRKIYTLMCVAGGTASHQHAWKHVQCAYVCVCVCVCVCVGRIWQNAAKRGSCAEHFCTKLDGKEFLRFPIRHADAKSSQQSFDAQCHPVDIVPRSTLTHTAAPVGQSDTTIPLNIQGGRKSHFTLQAT